MTALIIILAVILLILLVAMIGITVILTADGEMICTLKILFFRFRLFPKIKKRPVLKNFKIKKFRKNRLREEKKLIKLAEKKVKKQKKAADKADKTEEKTEEEPELRDNVQYYLELVKRVLFEALKKFGKHLVITIRRLDITVSGDDPSRIALTYGYASQAVSYIMELADCNLNTRYRGEPPYVSVGVDWLSGKSSVKLDISLKVRVWQIISVLFTALKGYISVDKPKPRVKEPDDYGETKNKRESTPKNDKETATAVNGG